MVYSLFIRIRGAFAGAAALTVFGGYCVVAALILISIFGFTPLGMLLLISLLLFATIIGFGFDILEKRRKRYPRPE